jgi:hypothetical protein
VPNLKPENWLIPQDLVGPLGRASAHLGQPVELAQANVVAPTVEPLAHHLGGEERRPQPEHALGQLPVRFR